VAADVGQPADVERIGQTAMERFGRIDTWINNAGVSIFGRNEDIPLEDMQRLFQTNYWGVVHGSLEAVKHMKTRGGGAIINLGSELSDHSIPLQGIYAASKHAVKAFTDSLRMELEKEMRRFPSRWSSRPDRHHVRRTRRTTWTRNRCCRRRCTRRNWRPRSILYAAQHPKRDVFVGGAAKALSASNATMPGLLERYLRTTMFKQQQSKSSSPPNRQDALYAPNPNQEMRQRQDQSKAVIENCAYTSAALRSDKILPLLVGGAALFGAWKLARRPGGLRPAS
jgi:short-subunit dehydrogenase